MKSIRNVLAGTLIAGSALLASATSILIANAQEPSTGTQTASTGEPGPAGGHGWHHHHGGPWRMYGKLGLSDQQKASIKSIMMTAKPQMQSLHQQMRANEMKLMQATPGSANYSSVVAEVAQSNATLASQRTTQGSELQAQMYAVLTPAQKTQMASLQAEWAAKAAARGSAR